MKKSFKELPPADFLLYQKVTDFVTEYCKESSSITDHQKFVIEQKILYIIQSISLRYYKMPLFRDDFVAYREGPVIEKINKIQDKKNKIVKNPQKIIKEDLSYYQFIADQLLQIVIDGFTQELLPMNHQILSKLTHTGEWKKKFNQRDQETDLKRKNTLGKMVDKELLNFYTSLEHKYPDFTNFAKESLGV